MSDNNEGGIKRNPPTNEEWKFAEVLADQQASFVLWMISKGVCKTVKDFDANFDLSNGFPLREVLSKLQKDGFLEEKHGALKLLPPGEEIIAHLSSVTEGHLEKNKGRGTSKGGRA